MSDYWRSTKWEECCLIIDWYTLIIRGNRKKGRRGDNYERCTSIIHRYRILYVRVNESIRSYGNLPYAQSSLLSSEVVESWLEFTTPFSLAAAFSSVFSWKLIINTVSFRNQVSSRLSLPYLFFVFLLFFLAWRLARLGTLQRINKFQIYWIKSVLDYYLEWSTVPPLSVLHPPWAESSDLPGRSFLPLHSAVPLLRTSRLPRVPRSFRVFGARQSRLRDASEGRRRIRWLQGREWRCTNGEHPAHERPEKGEMVRDSLVCGPTNSMFHQAYLSLWAMDTFDRASSYVVVNNFNHGLGERPQQKKYKSEF